MQDLCWKVHDSAQSFVLYLYSMQVSIGLFLRTEQTDIVFCAGSRAKTEQQHTTKNFDVFHNHSPLLTMGSVK